MGNGLRVGTVGALYHFPVKSMRGALVDAFVRSDDRSFFPWLTARQVPILLAHTPILANPSDPSDSPIVVRTPEGEELALESDVLRAPRRSLRRPDPPNAEQSRHLRRRRHLADRAIPPVVEHALPPKRPRQRLQQRRVCPGLRHSGA